MKHINIRNSVLSIILILALILGAGCNLLTGTDTTPPPPATDNTTTVKPEGVIPVVESPTTPGSSEEPITISQNPSPVLPSIADVVARVKPSVVAINTEVVASDFFNRQYTQEGAGSGWIIDANGYIVTNNHVIAGAESITVTLYDDRTFPAEIVGNDPLTDLAVLKIDAENLPAAATGDSETLRVGDWVVAIGNSLGQGIRATQGIVSRQGVSVPVDQSQTLYGLIETDAAINPGNSGGPLVNMAGEVIGINSAKRTQVEVEGVGYAISSNQAIPIIGQLINLGHALHPWLGVGLYTVDQFAIAQLELTIDRGALITSLAPDSPADKAGLKQYDVIIGFAGKEIDTVDDLIQAIRSAQIGQEVTITYWRGNSENTASATLIERPIAP
ncbi:S1C family serine protease [Chloroflexota bacterium]